MVSHCNSEACAGLAQAQEASSLLERALQIVDRLELALAGARIQHAIDTLAADFESLADDCCSRAH